MTTIHSVLAAILLTKKMVPYGLSASRFLKIKSLNSLHPHVKSVYFYSNCDLVIKLPSSLLWKNVFIGGVEIFVCCHILGVSLAQDRGRMEAKIEALSSEVATLKKHLEVCTSKVTRFCVSQLSRYLIVFIFYCFCKFILSYCVV